MALKVAKAAVVGLLQALGMKTANQYTDKQLQDKITTLPKVVDEDTDKVKDAKQLQTLKALLKAAAGKEEVILTDGAKEAPAAKTPSKPAVKPKAKVEEEEDEEDEDTEDDGDGEEDSEDEEAESDEEDGEEVEEVESEPEDEEEESEDEDSEEDGDEEDQPEDEEDEEVAPAAKTPAKKPPAKAGKPAAKEPAKAEKPKQAAPPKKVGVISTILECLAKAGKDKPVTKDEIVKVLVKKFPEREEKAMRSTVNSQVPSGLKTEKNLELQKNGEGGFWLSKDDRAKYLPAEKAKK